MARSPESRNRGIASVLMVWRSGTVLSAGTPPCRQTRSIQTNEPVGYDGLCLIKNQFLALHCAAGHQESPFSLICNCCDEAGQVPGCLAEREGFEPKPYDAVLES